ncbi:glycosyltransferase family 4 protein [Parahaliea mediterranea]|uniref:Glycosyltransferase family 4 protein n=1 Tax=Parahaliea mediterranea TaxID=651086 RepID=A0A939DBU6_9GAMM|nr:glycosyltransferase family 1 protein [Parahaliea mediterranea]MBN7795190.1 glycosyltransferase family 4 protein [Parahaliea mediterranea]
MTPEPLRIAVDARPLCHPGTGIYRHTVELLRRLCRRGGQWYFYSVQPYDDGDFRLPNVSHRTLRLPRSLRASQLAHVVFPCWARKDAVQVFWGTRHQLPAGLPAGARRILTLYDFVWRRYGETMRFPGRQIEALFTPPALARAEVIATISEFTAGELSHFYPRFADKAVTVPCASVLGPGVGENGLAQGSGRGYFLAVGTLEPRKNLRRVLYAYRDYVKQQQAEARPRRLKIVGGEGWGGERLPELVSELGLEKLVDLTGRVSDELLVGLYRGAHALLMPSLYEGFGLPVAEAMSASLPVITSRNSPMAEVAGEAAVLVDPLSEAEIAAAMTRLCVDSQLHASLRAACAGRARRYSWERSADVMWRVLHGPQRSGSDRKPAEQPEVSS